MSEDLIQLPNVADIREMLDIAKQDIKNEVEEDSELQSSSELLMEVIKVIEGKLTKAKNFDALKTEEKIDIAAHLNFLQALLEDFFMFDDEEDFDDEEMFEDEDEDDEEEEEKK